MRSIVLLILVLASLGLSGCKADRASQSSSETGSTAAMREREDSFPPEPAGTDVATNDAPPRSNQSDPHDPRPLLVCFGDSLTAGYGAEQGQSYPDFLQKDLDRAGYKYHVINDGVSGNTTKDGLDRLDGVIALKPAVVIVEFGGNDGLRGFKVQTTHDNLATIIQKLQSAGIQVVIAGITLPPDYGPDYVNAFTKNYPDLARQFKTPLYPFLLKDAFGVTGMMQRDNTHATGKGNEIVARNLLPTLTPILKK